MIPAPRRRPRLVVVSAVEEEREAWRSRLQREDHFELTDFRSLAEALSSLPLLFEAAIIELPSVHPVTLPWLGRLHARQPGALVIVRVPTPDEEIEQAFRAAGCSAVFAREEGRERTVAFLYAGLAPERAP
jgi:hypothetical protein